MNKPKFLQRFNKRKIREAELNGEIRNLKEALYRQRHIIDENSKFIEELKRQKSQREMQLYLEEKDKTDPFKADQWKVVYSPKGELSKVYLNGQQLFGACNFSIDFDGETQTPYFNYYGSGSIEVITESE